MDYSTYRHACMQVVQQWWLASTLRVVALKSIGLSIVKDSMLPRRLLILGTFVSIQHNTFHFQVTSPTTTLTDYTQAHCPIKLSSSPQQPVGFSFPIWLANGILCWPISLFTSLTQISQISKAFCHPRVVGFSKTCEGVMKMPMEKVISSLESIS